MSCLSARWEWPDWRYEGGFQREIIWPGRCAKALPSFIHHERLALHRFDIVHLTACGVNPPPRWCQPATIAPLSCRPQPFTETGQRCCRAGKRLRRFRAQSSHPAPQPASTSRPCCFTAASALALTGGDFDQAILLVARVGARLCESMNPGS
jgi:hypothetical protein